VSPVPPDVVGRAVPDKVMASVPEVVIGEPETDKKDGTDAETEVTVPVAAQDRVVPFDVRTVFTPPTVVRPVPPDVVGRAVPDKPIVIAGVVVGSVTDTFRKDGVDAETVVTVPVPGVEGVTHARVVPFDVRTCPSVPTDVRPVPPFEVGRGTPAVRLREIFPDDVIGDPETVRNGAATSPTEVTVPDPATDCHEVDPAPSVCKNWPADPRFGGRDII
jgi:hypothetical protein